MRYLSRLTVLIITVVLGIIALILYLYHLNSASSTFLVAKESTSVSSDYSQRLAPNVRMQLNQVPATENPQVEILVRIAGTLESGQRSQLEAAGMQIRGLMGEIIVGVIDLRQIPRIAELEFVRYIELSSPVYPHSSP